MPAASRRITFVLGLVIGLARQSFAQDLCLPIPPTRNPLPAPEETSPATTLDDSIEITAGQIDVSDESSTFSGQVEVKFRDGVLSTETATYTEGNVAIPGRVNFVGPDFLVYGADADVDTKAETIRFSGAGFDLPSRPARGSADEILIDSESHLSLVKVLFTTCPAEHNAWELHARDIRLDVNGGVGTARGVKLAFKGVPILYAPYFSFPLDDQRKSGFLTPDIGRRDRTGFDVKVPYYFNLAPNYDLTLEPRYMSKRGLQLRSDFRYLLKSSEGQFGFEYLPHDDEIGDTRRYITLQHESLFGASDQWLVRTTAEQVSDDTYFDDLGSSLSITSQTHLNRFVDLGFLAPYWSMIARFQNYQTIDPILTDIEKPYERVPQIQFKGRWFGRLIAFDSVTEIVDFDRNVGVTGWRLDSTQELSLRFARAGMYLTPAIALRETDYWLDNPEPGQDDTLSRALPIGSVDMGIRFEREIERGTRSWLHTLEPRLLYVQVPYEDQSALPVFDTILPDFNLVQLFRKYQFVGPDRITDTDQWSFGVTTRLVDAINGRERLTATLGQTRYLTAQHVALPDSLPNSGSASDYVAEIAIGMRDNWALDLGYQWNNETSTRARTETRFEYRPKNDRLFGLGYRYRREALEQGDVSLVWPVAKKWRVIGRYSYSFLEKEPLEQFFGWEYEACCWRLRMVGRNYVSRRTGETDTAISLQLELKGFSQRVMAPEDLLDRGILGYRNITRAY